MYDFKDYFQEMQPNMSFSDRRRRNIVLRMVK